MSRHRGTSTGRNRPQYQTPRLDLTVEQLVAVGLNGQPVGDCLQVILLLNDGIPQVGVIGDQLDGCRHRTVDPCYQGVTDQHLVVEANTRDQTLSLRFRLRKREAETFGDIPKDSTTTGAIDSCKSLGNGVESECNGVSEHDV